MFRKPVITMKIFKIPVEYAMYGTIEVEAETLEQAIKKAKDDEEDYNLPKESYYLDDSFQVNDDIDLIKALNNIK